MNTLPLLVGMPGSLIGPVPALEPVAAPGQASPAPTSTAYDLIDAYIERHMRRLNIPGAAL